MKWETPTLTREKDNDKCLKKMALPKRGISGLRFKFNKNQDARMTASAIEKKYKHIDI